ncbi:MAG: Unknown protein [uncultured Thiotrichaceae bacterium]|uniref:Uncharacterized protein n=1 Tax=uncultured Thiotrichaceae bacterium TaxID=298394 RepID=A0A6S6U535_9GAMM|nr:MAG: Unknown protein [uncultured Thiotrichaceae bacterium]
MNKLLEYSQFTYLIELIAIGLLAVAILGVTLSITYRQISAKKKHAKLSLLNQQAEEKSYIIQKKLDSLGNIEKNFQENINASKTQLEAIQDEQNATSERADEIEKRAEHIAQLENEMKNTIDTITERLNHIQTYWDKQLNDTVNTINQINAKLDDGLQRTIEQERIANNLMLELTDKYGSISTLSDVESPMQQQIQGNLLASLEESEKLLTQLKGYQTKAESSFNHFSEEMNGFESQAVKQFDAVFNTADIARQEMNASLAENPDYVHKLHNTNDDIDKNNDKLEPEAITDKPLSELTLEGVERIELTKPGEVVVSGALEDDDTIIPAPAEKLVEQSVGNRKEKEKSTLADRDDRPIINMSSAEDLTDPALLEKYGGYSNDSDKKQASLLSKIRKHGS